MSIPNMVKLWGLFRKGTEIGLESSLNPLAARYFCGDAAAFKLSVLIFFSTGLIGISPALRKMCS